jgi:hypothetical protein
MKIMENSEVVQAVARFYNKPVLYLYYYSNESISFEEFLNAIVPQFLESDINVDVASLFYGKPLYILCDDEEELNTLFYYFVGDDGPTKSNSYKGRVSIFAMTCSAAGEMQNENT